MAAHDPFRGLSRVFCDTSFLFANLCPTDANHQKAKSYSRLILKHHIECLTLWDVISETLTLLVARYSYQAAVLFADLIEPNLIKVEYDDDLRQKAKKSFKKFNKDHVVSFCDCLSYQIIRRTKQHDLC